MSALSLRTPFDFNPVEKSDEAYLVDDTSADGVEQSHGERQVNIFEVALGPAVVLLDLGHVFDQPQRVGQRQAGLGGEREQAVCQT